MSKLKLFVQNCVLAFFALTMCAGMVSCGGSDSDDEVKKDDSEVVTSGKKLVEISCSINDDEDVKVSYTYDKKGHVSSILWDEDMYTCEWTDNNIIINTEDEYEVIDLPDGLVEKSVNDYRRGSHTFTYAYNSFGHLSEVSWTGSFAFSNALLYWNSDKITSTKFSNNLDAGGYVSSSSTYTYSGKTCKGWCPFILDFSIWFAITEFDTMLFAAHPELIGLRNMNSLPSKRYDKDYQGMDGVNATTTYEYELDKEGYVVRCVAKTQTSGRGDIDADIEISTYTFKWE